MNCLQIFRPILNLANAEEHCFRQKIRCSGLTQCMAKSGKIPFFLLPIFSTLLSISQSQAEVRQFFPGLFHSYYSENKSVGNTVRLGLGTNFQVRKRFRFGRSQFLTNRNYSYAHMTDLNLFYEVLNIPNLL